MKPTTRRKFIRWSALSVPFLSSFPTQAAKPKVVKPIIVSTWESGLAVNEEAWKVLEQKTGRALDAVEAAARHIENSINCCVGLGGNPDRDGRVTLDASIMDHQFNCGSVAALERIKHPISVARKVMESTPHVFLVGEGAQQFALENGFPLESEELSQEAQNQYKEWLKKSEYKPIINIEKQQMNAFPKKSNGPFAPAHLEDGNFNHDTMGSIALDFAGNLSGACTTSGMGFKMRGRVGDSPIIGSGLYVDNAVGAATSSGQGEEVIRICGTFLIIELMRNGKSPFEACKTAIERLVQINPKKAEGFQVGFIALSKTGEYGAYSVAPGFTFSVRDASGEGRVYEAKSYFS